MRFKDLGKTHRVRIFQMEIRIITIVALIGGWLIGTLVYVWFQPLHYGVTVGLAILVALLSAKLSEVPFCKEILIHPLKRRVSFDP